MPRTIPYIDTEVKVEKTVAEMESILQVHGASHVMKEFESGRIKSLAFKHGDIPFQLPVNVEACYQVIYSAKKALPKNRYYVTDAQRHQWHEQAERCAWRNVMAWVKAQLALVEIGMVTVTEVFLPYMLVGSQETLYNRMLKDGFQDVRALGPGSEITVEGKPNG
jgi:hypothetical protein